MAIWYCGSTKWTAVTAWAALTVYAAGAVRRQLATPTVGSERVFVCIIAGTSLAAEPTWTVTKGAKTAEAAGPTWQECTGQAGVNGDLTNTPNWTSVKNTSVALGKIIQRNSAGSLQICSTAGTAGNGAEPAFSNTAGTTTADNTVTWTSLGVPSNFAAYAAPWARLNLGMGASPFVAALDTVYVSNNHAETQTTAISYTATPNGLTVYCVSDTVAPPTTLATTATVKTTGASNLQVRSNGGTLYIYGVSFAAGNGSSNAITQIGDNNNRNSFVLESCGLGLGTTSITNTGIVLGSATNFGGGSGYGKLINPTITFGATGQSFSFCMGQLEIYGGTFAATGSVPTTAINSGAGAAPFLEAATLIIDGVDFTNITGALFGSMAGADTGMVNIFVNNCKVGSGCTFVNSGDQTQTQQNGRYITLSNVDSGATNYRYFYQHPFGNVQSETSIVRTGGAGDGVTPLSWNMVSNANSSFISPFISQEIAQWQDTTGGSLTATIELTTDATLTNADCWLQLEYPSASGSPLGAFVTTRVTPLATAAALTTSTAVWGGTAKTNKYKLQATFTPQMKGVVKARIFLTKVSTTIYIDPIISGLGSTRRSYLIPNMGYVIEMAGAIFSRIFTGF